MCKKILIISIIASVSASLLRGRELILISSRISDVKHHIWVPDTCIALGDVVKAIGKCGWQKDDYYYGEIVKITETYILLSRSETSTVWLERKDWGFEIYVPLQTKQHSWSGRIGVGPQIHIRLEDKNEISK